MSTRWCNTSKLGSVPSRTCQVSYRHNLLRFSAQSTAWRGRASARTRFACLSKASSDVQRRTLQRAPVMVEVEKTSWNSRRLFAGVPIAAPLQTVWESLTDYDNLHTFIPNLVQNRCLERRPQGCLLYQVGGKEIAAGLKFSAAVTLECMEFLAGLPRSMCSNTSDNVQLLFPAPRMDVKGMAHRDITFTLVEGDFEAFKGVWRMQQQDETANSTLLTYSLYVKPQQWLPVGLIQGHIEREIKANLDSIRQHTEHLTHLRNQRA